MSRLKEMEIINFPLNLLSSGAYNPPEITNLFIINQIKLQRKRISISRVGICSSPSFESFGAYVLYALILASDFLFLKGLNY